MYVVDLYNELNGLGLLVSDDATYMMTVDADNMVTDFPKGVSCP